MVDKSSNYEYLATYVDDILIWSKDLMAVVKELEGCRQSKISFEWKCRIPWRSMEESGIALYLNKAFLSCHTLIHLMLTIKMSKENIQI
jgi:hypothetical protein